MPEIQVLPDLLVSKIAAGEVIERPASVVKELVENSLDAGARRMEIAIEQGGRKLIRVVDDGTGMDREDLALCVRPHATSKIRREEDLFGIRTMGFRGEALPSIGAVSQLRIVSRQASSDEAYEVRVAADHVEPITAVSGPPGTTVEVRELFFNLPARQKFLRTAQTEVGHVSEQLARVALAHPTVEFRLTHNDRLVHHLRPAQGMRSRIADFYGRDLADALLEVAREEGGLRIHGYVAPPAESRSSGKWQYLFLNGRYIRDRFITHAVREAYRGLIEAHRYPVFFIALELEPAGVDVNVHPTKIEVRWRDSNALYSQVLSALRDRFLNADLTPELQTAAGAPQTDRHAADRSGASTSRQRIAPAAPGSAGLSVPGGADATVEGDLEEARRQKIRESIADFFKRARPVTGDQPRGSGKTAPSPGRVPISVPGQPIDRAKGPLGATAGASTDAPGPPAAEPQVVPASALPDAADTPAGGDRHPPADDLNYDNVIQVHRAYLVAESADGLLIVDQHALHERILFEQLAEQISRGPLESQRMLIPETIDISPDQVAVIETHADTLAQLGFELTPYGPSTLALHAAPTLLKPERVLEFLRDMLDLLAVQSGPASMEMLVNDLLGMMACKAAVRAGDQLSPQEVQALMSQRHRVERSSNCPHGRPTSLRLTLRDLERQFRRT